MVADVLPENLKEAVELLDELFEDTGLPKNIRNVCAEIKKELLSKDRDIKIRIDSAIHNLDLLSDDINLSVYARTQVWNIISLLESA